MTTKLTLSGSKKRVLPRFGRLAISLALCLVSASYLGLITVEHLLSSSTAKANTTSVLTWVVGPNNDAFL